ncbi:MAG TPA: sigma-70 family RNA polymerase sigma factor [Armatimonadota bacterium]|nr:sigma-70 family RNA polymerase sigma factor [Armatimonadota bacterium]HOS42076.1 sigma-70 family RNA polymerase sigma factor [Armatimonadota bacterium]
MDDAALIEATLRGDVEAFGRLVQRYQHALVAAARHLTRHAEDAEDLAQEALVDAYRHLRSLKDRTKFRGWVFGILRHKCLTALKRRKPEPVSLDECAELPALSPAEIGGDLADLLDSLPLASREILAARYVQELSYEEIAEALGTSVNTVRVRCCRARERLRALFAARGREGGVRC